MNNPWEQMPLSTEMGGAGGIMGQVPEHKKENMVDELLHNYVLMPQMARAKDQLKQLLLQQYMGGMVDAGQTP